MGKYVYVLCSHDEVIGPCNTVPAGKTTKFISVDLFDEMQTI